VDDAYDYGRVAATNSLSDVYAMGGKPVVALNIAGFPEKVLPAAVLREILRGGADVARAAGVSIVGGHTVNDAEVKYGLAVVGMIDPRRIVRNAGARVGDRLILTKPIGTGVLATALKAGALSPESTERLVGVMTTLNDKASAAMLQHDARACTDITGFGLIGHAAEMADGSDVTIALRAADVPFIEGTYDAAAQGYLTGGGNNTRKFLADAVALPASLDEAIVRLLFDAQTSGGLLIAVAPDQADALLAQLLPGHPQAAIIGECRARGDASIMVE
ncbi:MAG TPA: selenide, water dikinase SelD, partial [Candidatus Krumholzibacteria bacterium]|nr:selenide, water dikinase SelD [Candidatus Krumholzibacteria bacterium]